MVSMIMGAPSRQGAAHARAVSGFGLRACQHVFERSGKMREDIAMRLARTASPEAEKSLHGYLPLLSGGLKNGVS
ncbi:hypothetical protein [Breoghania sp.]|uniref:hypothetical protein n=1 Tax=Breoghania sp. TaxID=2065378 RepID=UPI002AAAEAF5|nr:hypothetical protein [Breoghania sp.]